MYCISSPFCILWWIHLGSAQCPLPHPQRCLAALRVVVVLLPGHPYRMWHARPYIDHTLGSKCRHLPVHTVGFDPRERRMCGRWASAMEGGTKECSQSETVNTHRHVHNTYIQLSHSQQHTLTTFRCLQ